MDSDHFRKTVQIGSLSLASSREAGRRARNPQLLAFAKLEIAEQESIAALMLSMSEGKKGVPGVIPHPSDRRVESFMGSEGKATLLRLVQQENGQRFDQAYLALEVQGHRALLSVQERFIQRGGNQEQINSARVARATVHEHMLILKKIKL